MTLQALANIQRDLKAPKGQTNTFGKYKYRSCEDILEAVKPLLAREGVVLTISDEMVAVGDRFYVKATATVQSTTDASTASVTAFAREAETKKGMDEAQITGSASSYARKYALNGLFAIDDTKDADTMDNRAPQKQQKTPQARFVEKLGQEFDLTPDHVLSIVQHLTGKQTGVATPAELKELFTVITDWYAATSNRGQFLARAIIEGTGEYDA